MFRPLRPVAAFVASAWFTFGAVPMIGAGRTLEIFPGTNVFGPAVQGLLPGDTLIVHQGTYNETSRMSIQVQGTAAEPIVVMGAAGESRPVITRPGTASLQNTVNIEGSAKYLTLRGLEIVGNGGDGVNMSGLLSFITLEDLVIHDVDVGVNFRNSMNNITVRRNNIYNLGIGGGTGEGMYVGCNNATCIVRDSLLELNWIHDTLPGATQGDGIEVKVGSHSNLIRDNVISNVLYPGIFVYGTGSNPVNIVEGNVIWNALEGIYAPADAIIRNNIVFNSGTGLSLYGHSQVAQMKNVTAVNNTLYNNDTGVYMRWSGSSANMVLANNAVYSPGQTALNAGGSVGTFSKNYVEGGSDRTLDNAAFLSGGSATNAFVDPANRNVWPKPSAPFIAAGNSTYAAAQDFNQSNRSAPIDVGAYESNGAASNPGWIVVLGFKTVSALPPPDTTIPVVAIGTPSSGATLAGTQTLTATASDNVGVAGVQFRVDGTNVGVEDTAAPYSVSWNTSTVSDGAHAITAIARDAAGNQAISASVTITVSNAAPPDPDPPATSTFSIPANGGSTWATTTTGIAMATGSLRVQADAGLSLPAGLAVFRNRVGGILVSEAGVPVTPPAQSGRIIAEISGRVTTGIALANPSSQDAVVSFYFTNLQGTDFGANSFVLRANGQHYGLLTDAPFDAPETLQGTFTFNASIPVSVIAVRGYTNERAEFLMTTLQVSPVSSSLGTSPVVFPQFADGAGWSSEVILTNPGNATLSGVVEFFGQSGTAQGPSPLTVFIGGVGCSSWNYQIPPRGVARLVTDGSGGSTQVGWARLSPFPANSVPSGLVIFSFRRNGVVVTEASVSATLPAQAFRIPIEYSGAGMIGPGAISAGLAVANPASSPAQISLQAIAINGAAGPSGSVNIPAGGQVARFIHEFIPGLPPDFHGVIRLTASAPVSVMGLRARYNERGDFLIATTPPVDESAAFTYPELIFPHVVGGAGFTTELMLFSRTGSNTSGRLLFLSSDGMLQLPD